MQSRARQLTAERSLRMFEPLILEAAQKAWPSPGNSCIGSIRAYTTTSWSALTHHVVQQALTLQQCLFGDTEERYHKPIDRSGFTPASRLQRSVGQRECKSLISFSVFHFGHNFESDGWDREQLAHFGSKLHSVEECPTDAPRARQLTAERSLRMFEPLILEAAQKAWPSPRNSCIGSIRAYTTTSWSALTHHVVQQARIQRVNPPSLIYSINPTTMSLSGTPKRYHKPIDRSGFTPASRLQRSVGQRECKRYPQNTISLLRDTANGEHAGWQTNGVSRKQIKQHSQNI
ncbi:hypothetical protein TNCV_2670531 [Trichonephila clavipes]|nr:hypothetical protein TNCV_2670531 [Trichonephila clavipes]